jgi:hypothetical protein
MVFAASSAAANSSMALIFFRDDLVADPTTVADKDHVTKVRPMTLDAMKNESVCHVC